MLERFEAEYEIKCPKAAKCVRRDQKTLLSLIEFPGRGWEHLRTTNVIDSPFATVRLRQRVTKAAGSRTKGLLMPLKFLDMAKR